MRKLFSLIVLSSACLAMNAAVEEFNFSYATNPDATPSAFGTGKYVDYDVAIHLNDPAYEGYEIVGISMDIPSERGECAPTGYGWLASDLVLAPTGVTIPDIDIVEDVPIINRGTDENPNLGMEIRFPSPYKITADGVYAGYTITVTNLKNWTATYPVVTVPSDNPEGGLFVHCSKGASGSGYKYLEWTNLATSRKEVSTMRVILRGERGEFAVSPSTREKHYSVTDSEKSINIALTNHGVTDIKNFDYEVTIGDKVIGGDTVELPTDLIGELGAQTNANISYTTPEEEGDYTATLTITKVNGNENTDSKKYFNFNIGAREIIPVHRPLMEEYTGLWCQYCPQAYVAVAELRERHPNQFICLTFHVNDALSAIYPGKLPHPNAGQPSLYMERVNTVRDFSGVFDQWQDCADDLAPASIDVKIYWTDESKTAIRAESIVNFIDSYNDADYSISYALVEDNMKDPSWKQRNSFWQENVAPFESKYWDIFLGTQWDVSDVVYDDVVMVAPDPNGIENSVPSNITKNEDYLHFTELSLKDAKNSSSLSEVYGQNIIKNKDNLRVVAVLIDNKTKRAVNSNTSDYTLNASVYDPNVVGIDKISAENNNSAVVNREIYSLDGKRLPAMPENGAVIVVDRLEDGSVKTAKILQ